jgi:hypothetical protein
MNPSSSPSAAPVALHNDFETFKTAFDACLENTPDALQSHGILFLRYEDLEAASHLHTVAERGLTAEQALADHLATLERCQDYAMSHAVTSTYIFFHSERYRHWIEMRAKEDTLENRALWAQTKSDEELVPHPAEGIIWFHSTGMPVKDFVAVLE